MMSVMIPILYLAIFGAIYAILYYFNHKTPLPEGCENLKAQCNGCHDASCCNHPSHTIEERGVK